MELQTSLSLLHGSSATPFPETQNQYGREPFRHPALDGLVGVSVESKSKVLTIARMSQLAEKYGLDNVVRWKPRMVRSSSIIWPTSIHGTELTVYFLDDECQRIRLADSGNASALCNCGGCRITKGGRGCK